jgi:hypothetical protein
MYMNNFHRWDFDKVAALCAPRPLLISNTDKDDIFPLDGVMQIFRSSRRLYHLLGKDNNLGLQMAEGPHHDSQPLNIGAFHWFDRFFKGTDAMATIREPALPAFKNDDLRVFKTLPLDQINTTVDRYFVPAFQPPPVPKNKAEWEALKAGWMEQLRRHVFPNGLPNETLDVPPQKDPHVARRFALIGRPQDMWRNKSAPEDGIGEMYRTLLAGKTGEITLRNGAASHAEGPYYFNILRYLDLPQAVAMAAEKNRVTIHGKPADWKWAIETAAAMGFSGNLVIKE